MHDDSINSTPNGRLPWQRLWQTFHMPLGGLVLQRGLRCSARAGKKLYHYGRSIAGWICMTTHAPALGLFCPQMEDRAEAKQLAEQWQLPLLEQWPQAGRVLVWQDGRLSLDTMGRGAPGPVLVDWTEPRARRRLQTSGRSQPLARAVGFKPGVTPRVLDATGGLGQDAFVLAWLGAEVDVLERSPVAAALLSDGLRRAADDAQLAAAAARMHLRWQDARSGLASWPEELRPDSVYLDPMYPEHGRTALSSRSMQAFQQVIGADEDAAELLPLAMQVARRRVVVKRPRKAAFLAGVQPFTQLVGESTRFDVYMILGA